MPISQNTQQHKQRSDSSTVIRRYLISVTKCKSPGVQPNSLFSGPYELNIFPAKIAFFEPEI